ncbi:MAG: transketolase [Ignavibacteria bacterium]|jgi:transketolase|nr:transketolase [Ignavibacteria bacterium]MCU7502421.1 transketolase [Ignavibacteria bacterium]MCU7515014.1 transketolase [Ignavibacteria bacterium]
MSEKANELDQLCINTIRFLAVDAVQKANSGHPGMPMGCAPIAYRLFTKYMRYNPENPKWFNRDKFVLSAGHGSMLLYSMLYLTGYDLSMEDLKNFRQWESRTPGHPEAILTPGVETTTGPLGQGITNSVGMAVAQEFLAAKFNKGDIKLLDHYIYVIASDGDMMEGISHEAASFAGHQRLGKLIVFYDDNNISIDGSTGLSFSEDVGKRFEAYGWHVQHLDDVNDLEAMDRAIENAQNEKDRPSFIVTKTHIGFGSPNKQDSSSSHGSPLGAEEVKLTKKNLGWPEDKTFYVPEEVSKFFSQFKQKGQKLEEEWKKKFEEYCRQYPEEGKLFEKVMTGNFGDKWQSKLPRFAVEEKGMATRSASGKTLNAIASSLPTLIGGSADLAPSNNTELKGYAAFSPEHRDGRNFHFGVREHAMASMLNGMAIYGGVIPYGGTFLVFSDYLRPAIRLGILSGLRPIYVFTHDSIGLGEDGPTHQPIEHLAALRAIPEVIVIRPADANETSYAWKAAIEHKGSPVALILTRQNVPVIDQDKYPGAEGLLKGAYVLRDTGGAKPDIILMASGSEVQHILGAAERLESEGIKARCVSVPSFELFDRQPEEYKKSVLLPEVKARLSVEAGVKMGWEKYLGEEGEAISMERFGVSAPSGVLMEKFGFTAQNVFKRAKEVLGKVKSSK